MTQVADPVDRYALEAERSDAAWQGGQPAWLGRVRRHARDRFRALQFPTPRDEEWRFTSVAPIAETAFVLAEDGSTLGTDDVEPFLLAEAGTEIVFVNGKYAPWLSRIRTPPRGVRVESLASALTTDAGEIEASLGGGVSLEQQAFTALNTALFVDGALVTVARGTIVERPIHLLFIAHQPAHTGLGQRAQDRRAEVPPTMSHPRVLVVAGEGSQMTVVESYVGLNGDRYFTNAVTEILVGDNATVDHYKLQQESLGGYHIGTMHVVARRHAAFSSHSLSFGGSLVRNDVTALLDGEGVDCTLNGLYLVDGRRLVDNHTTIDHAKPHCGSREVYKGILADHARAVFNGKIVVRPDAQKTDAKQTNKALLLAEDAQINTKPQLEIFANDVRCTHGAAVGQMDDEAVFYLRTRGFSRHEARNLLIHAFAGDVLHRMRLEPLRARAEALLLRHLPGIVPAV